MPVIRSIPQFEALRDDWNALADAHAHALLRHEWFLSAARTIHARDSLAVVVQENGGRVYSAAPLVRTARRGVDRLEFLGASVLQEPSGLLALEADTRSALLDEVFSQRYPLILQRLSTNEANTGDMRRVVRGRGLLLSKSTTPTLVLELTGGEGVIERLPSKLRYDIKRARTRASQIGEVAMEVVAPDRANVADVLERFVKVEASGWKGRQRSALALNPTLLAFFSMYARLCAEAGTLRVFLLRIGEKMAAAQIAIEVYERLWVLKIGYDESMARCSPGFLLTAEAIQYAGQRQLRGYEFLGSVEAWEQRWRPRTRPCSLIRFYPWTARGCSGGAVDLAYALCRRVIAARDDARTGA